MPLEIHRFTLGPLQNNTYVLVESLSNQAVIVDPAFDSLKVVEAARQEGWQLQAIWITHAHFDHIAGVDDVLRGWGSPLPIALHPADLALWDSGGGAGYFGVRFQSGPTPTELLQDGAILRFGNHPVEVRHIPGHSRGHVVYYVQDAQALFCGDVIFQGSIGRTDLPGGDFDELISGIKDKVLSLPDETRLLPGHGPESTVGEERDNNPFLRDA